MAVIVIIVAVAVVVIAANAFMLRRAIGDIENTIRDEMEVAHGDLAEEVSDMLTSAVREAGAVATVAKTVGHSPFAKKGGFTVVERD